jgi:hypothetical protein
MKAKASLIALLVAAGLAATAQSTPPSRIKILAQPGSPAVLVGSRSSGTPRVILRNRSGKTIIAFRLGWMAETGKPSFGQRTMLHVPKQETAQIRAREFAAYPSAHFFIAELAFGDGTAWKADVTALRRQLTNRVLPKTVPV